MELKINLAAILRRDLKHEVGLQNFRQEKEETPIFSTGKTRKGEVSSVAVNDAGANTGNNAVYTVSYFLK